MRHHVIQYRFYFIDLDDNEIARLYDRKCPVDGFERINDDLRSFLWETCVDGAASYEIGCLSEFAVARVNICHDDAVVDGRQGSSKILDIFI
jgi:hypothetical protein